MSDVVIVTSLLPPLQGGPAGQTSKLAEYLENKGVDVSVVLVGNQNEIATIPRVSISRCRLPRRRIPGLAAVRTFFFAIVYLFRTSPRLVHIQVFNNPAAWGFVGASRLLGIPTYCKVASEGGVARQLSRGRNTDWRRLREYAAVSDKIFCKLANYVLATTETFQEILIKKYKIPGSKVLYFPNFTESDEANSLIDRRSLYGPEQSRTWRIVTVARGVRQKNFEACVAAARRLVELNHSFVWHFVGDFEAKYREELKELIDLHGLSTSVLFVGSMDADGVRRELKKAHVFVMLSHFEWFGISVIEAMDIGVPVVVSNVPGMAEIVEGCGASIDPGHPESAADAIVRMMMDEKHRSRQVEMARKRVDEKYRLPVTGEKLYCWFEGRMTVKS